MGIKGGAIQGYGEKAGITQDCPSESNLHPPNSELTHHLILWTHKYLSNPSSSSTQTTLIPITIFSSLEFPGDSDGKESACNVGDLGFIPGLGRSPGEKNKLPTPVFLPEEFHGQRSLAGYTVHGVAKSRTWLSNFQFSRLRLRKSSILISSQVVISNDHTVPAVMEKATWFLSTHVTLYDLKFHLSRATIWFPLTICALTYLLCFGFHWVSSLNLISITPHPTSPPPPTNFTVYFHSSGALFEFNNSYFMFHSLKNKF